MQRWILLILTSLAACGGANKPNTPPSNPPKPPPTTTPTGPAASGCGCVTEACRDKDFNAYFEATFCTWREQTCACTDPACIERALGPINDFKRSLVGQTITLPPDSVIERTSKLTDEANACIAKIGRVEP
jgi:hypothetical protein